MKGIIVSIFFFAALTDAFSQQVYQSTDVETVAAPEGGENLFNDFLTSNLRIPIKSSFKGLKGQVVLNAVVETDGSLSNLTVLKGIDELCNQEAIRVLSLYKAWKPAMLKNTVVRQEVVLPVVFNVDRVDGYDSLRHSLVTYFDKKMVETSNADKIKFRRYIPVDDFGIVNGDVLYEQRNGPEWETLSSVSPEKQEFWQKIYESEKVDSVKAIKVSIALQEKNTSWKQIVVQQMSGSLLSHDEFKSDKDPIRNKYYQNGLLKERQIFRGEKQEVIGWHGNGQLASIVLVPTIYKNPFVYVIKDVREPKGRQQVANGNGYACLDRNYTAQGIDGCGAVKNGLKEGIWTSKSKEGVLFYEENYIEGVLLKGTSYMEGNKFEYTEVEAQPEYIGGVSEMYKYIAQNMKYPRDAAKQGIQGRVYTSFVVGVDGSVEEVKLEKGLHGSLDEEAIRVVSGMNGKWRAGVQRGRKVRVKYNLPLIFQLE